MVQKRFTVDRLKKNKIIIYNKIIKNHYNLGLGFFPSLRVSYNLRNIMLLLFLC